MNPLKLVVPTTKQRNVSCATCRYWEVDQVQGKESDDNDIASCHRHAPRNMRADELVPGDEHPEDRRACQWTGVWPETFDNDFCGDWEPLFSVTADQVAPPASHRIKKEDVEEAKLWQNPDGYHKRRWDWIAKKLVTFHPDWSDRKIAQLVGVNPGTLSRSKFYQDAAALARKTEKEPR